MFPSAKPFTIHEWPTVHRGKLRAIGNIVTTLLHNRIENIFAAYQLDPQEMHNSARPSRGRKIRQTHKKEKSARPTRRKNPPELYRREIHKTWATVLPAWARPIL
jgi:DNA-binding protein H-NS